MALAGTSASVRLANQKNAYRLEQLYNHTWVSAGADAFTRVITGGGSLLEYWETAAANNNVKSCTLLRRWALDSESVLVNQNTDGVSGEEDITLKVALLLSASMSTSALLTARASVIELGARKTSIGTAGELVTTAAQNINAATARTVFSFAIDGAQLLEHDMLAVALDVVNNRPGGATNKYCRVDQIWLERNTHG